MATPNYSDTEILEKIAAAPWQVQAVCYSLLLSSYSPSDVWECIINVMTTYVPGAEESDIPYMPIPTMIATLKEHYDTDELRFSEEIARHAAYRDEAKLSSSATFLSTRLTGLLARNARVLNESITAGLRVDLQAIPTPNISTLMQRLGYWRLR